MSTPRIRVLSADLASQIAAGEVVERPASVVKELVENAIDAEATRVDVSIAGGGVGYLSVSDDGIGMTEADARLCIERHATSKLSMLEDLARVTSFGFRGEALPSIASVSRFRLTTRDRQSSEGVQVSVEGGAAARVEPTSGPVGTLVEVEDLFYNVPARRKFLRSTSTESGHVGDVLEAAALARPELTFTLTRDGRRAREWLRSSGREERVQQLFEGEALARCAGERGPLAIEAFLSRPERARSGSGGLRVLVNGRSVKDRSLSLTVAQAYGSVLERGRYPRGVLFVDVPSELVDVNVHPQKAEVRFAEPRALTDALYAILSKELARAFSLPAATRGSWGREPATNPAAERPDAPSDGRESNATSPPYSSQIAPATLPAEPEGSLWVSDSAPAFGRPNPNVRWGNLRFLAQVRRMFLICEGSEGLYVLDQHAAAERVTFSRLRRQYASRSVASQALLFPLTVELGELDTVLVEEALPRMAELGLDVRSRGERMVSIHAIPRLLSRASPERLLSDLLSELSRSGRGFSDAVDLALATLSCHGSLRAGDPLTAEEAAELLQALDDADFSGHCPHGRPVVTLSSWAELERQVGRR